MRLVILSVFSIAFAFVEAAVVVYLRELFAANDWLGVLDRTRPALNLGLITFIAPESAIFPDRAILKIEMWREAATLVVLAAAASLAAPALRQKLGAFLVAFSLWDLFYYVFLRLLIGWPQSLFDVDIFFLIPVAWVGPVITPVGISLLLLIIGLRLYVSSGAR